MSDGSRAQPKQARLSASEAGKGGLPSPAAGGAAAGGGAVAAGSAVVVASVASLSALSAASAARTSLVAAPRSGCCSCSLASSGLKPRSGSATRSPRTASRRAGVQGSHMRRGPGQGQPPPTGLLRPRGPVHARAHGHGPVARPRQKRHSLQTELPTTHRDQTLETRVTIFPTTQHDTPAHGAANTHFPRTPHTTIRPASDTPRFGWSPVPALTFREGSDTRTYQTPTRHTHAPSHHALHKCTATAAATAAAAAAAGASLVVAIGVEDELALLLLHDAQLDLGAEGADEALHRPRRGVAQRADGVPLDLVRELLEHVDFLDLGVARHWRG
eukprot:scaffold50638_cov55-Phaeocystis_antarctica.AAC.1